MDILSVMNQLTLYAAHERWQDVVRGASKAVIDLGTWPQRAPFYHVWICALSEQSECSGLHALGNHLRRLGAQHADHYPLAALAYAFSHQPRKAVKALKCWRQQYAWDKNPYALHAYGVLLADCKKRSSVLKGAQILHTVCHKTNLGYLPWRSYLRVLAKREDDEGLACAYQTLHELYPYAHEPYWAATAVAMDEENWQEAIRLLVQILKDRPQLSLALSALAYCDKALQGNAEDVQPNMLNPFAQPSVLAYMVPRRAS